MFLSSSSMGASLTTARLPFRWKGALGSGIECVRDPEHGRQLSPTPHSLMPPTAFCICCSGIPTSKCLYASVLSQTSQSRPGKWAAWLLPFFCPLLEPGTPSGKSFPWHLLPSQLPFNQLSQHPWVSPTSLVLCCKLSCVSKSLFLLHCLQGSWGWRFSYRL